MTAYELRISDWSSDVCSSDLAERSLQRHRGRRRPPGAAALALPHGLPGQLRDGAGDGRPPSLPCHGDEREQPAPLDPAAPAGQPYRKSVVEGKSVHIRLVLGGRRIVKTKQPSYVTKTL